jgi:glutamate synthase domain-containing protein 1
MRPNVIENVLDELGMKVFCVRDVPVKSSILGKASADCEPRMQQFFVYRPDACDQGISF